MLFHGIRTGILSVLIPVGIEWHFGLGRQWWWPENQVSFFLFLFFSFVDSPNSAGFRQDSRTGNQEVLVSMEGAPSVDAFASSSPSVSCFVIEDGSCLGSCLNGQSCEPDGCAACSALSIFGAFHNFTTNCGPKGASLLYEATVEIPSVATVHMSLCWGPTPLYLQLRAEYPEFGKVEANLTTTSWLPGKPVINMPSTQNCTCQGAHKQPAVSRKLAPTPSAAKMLLSLLRAR